MRIWSAAVRRFPAQPRRHLGRDELQCADGRVVVGYGGVELGDQVGGDRQHLLVQQRRDDLVGVAVEGVEPAQCLLLAAYPAPGPLKTPCQIRSVKSPAGGWMVNPVVPTA